MDAASWATTQESALTKKDEKEIEPQEVGAAKIIMHGAAIETRGLSGTPRPKRPCEEPEWQTTMITKTSRPWNGQEEMLCKKDSLHT